MAAVAARLSRYGPYHYHCELHTAYGPVKSGNRNVIFLTIRHPSQLRELLTAYPQITQVTLVRPSMCCMVSDRRTDATAQPTWEEDQRLEQACLALDLDYRNLTDPSFNAF